MKSHPGNSTGRAVSGSRTLCAGETHESAGSTPARGAKLCETTAARCVEPCPCAEHWKAYANRWRNIAFREEEILRVLIDAIETDNGKHGAASLARQFLRDTFEDEPFTPVTAKGKER